MMIMINRTSTITNRGDTFSVIATCEAVNALIQHTESLRLYSKIKSFAYISQRLILYHRMWLLLVVDISSKEAIISLRISSMIGFVCRTRLLILSHINIKSMIAWVSV